MDAQEFTHAIEEPDEQTIERDEVGFSRDEPFEPGLELDGLMAVLADDEAAGSIDPYITAAIRLFIFTGCRLGEILMLEWTSVDLDKGRLIFKKHKSDQHSCPMPVPGSPKPFSRPPPTMLGSICWLSAKAKRSHQ